MRISFLCFFLSLASLPIAFAQVPANGIGLNPLRLKWKQIHTDKVQVIFPQGLERSGQRVANMVHYLWDNALESIGDKKQKVSILLQNQTTVSNGFVTVGPFRSEFLVTPPQFPFNGTSDFVDMLTIHEYRHIQQFSNSRKGITKLARNLLGSWTWGGFAGTALPRWYWEGDAVGIETALTKAGRGRLPDFDMDYRGLWLNKNLYKYEKAAAFSIKDFVPDHYRLGYYMTTYARKHHGADIWNKVLDDAVRYRGVFYPFSRSLKKHTGLRTPELYRATIKELDSIWTKHYEKAEFTSSKQINKKPKEAPRNTFTSYRIPQYLPDGTLLVEKSNYSRIRTFYKMDSLGNEERVIAPGIYSRSQSSLSNAGYFFCWAERSFDARWGNLDFSIIKTYNMLTGKRNKVTSRTRFFAPAIDPKGEKIVTLEATENLKYQLVILDARNGTEIKRLDNPENYYYSFPRWTADGAHIVTLSQKGDYNWIEKINVDTQEAQRLTEPTSQQLSYPWPHEDYVYFMAAYTGTNNIFAVKPGDKTLYQVTSVPLGAFHPTVSPDGKKLAFSEFNGQGFDLKEMPLDPGNWKSYSVAPESSIQFFETLVEQEGGSITEKVPNEKFEIKKYNRWRGIINPHSVLGSFFFPNIGARLLSDNIFSTLSAEAFINYNINERASTYGLTFSYAELFPIINLGYIRSNRSRTLFDSFQGSDSTVAVTFTDGDWVENDFFAGLSLPLRLTGHNFISNLRLSATYHYLDVNVQSQINDPGNGRLDLLVPEDTQPSDFSNLFTIPLSDDQLHAIDLDLRFTNQKAAALQNINPRFAQAIRLRYRKTLGAGINSGEVFSYSGDFFFPGLSRNHSFFLNTAYQKENYTDRYKFRNTFFYSRGYGSIASDNVYKIGLNYTLPLLYPDLALGPLVFVKRIKANFFYDFTRGDISSWEPLAARTRDIRSAGMELTFDLRVVRLLEINTGIRYSYRLDDESARHQFDFLILNIGIF